MSMPSSRLLVATTAGSRPRLEVLLDRGAVLLAHRAVVGAREHGGAPATAPDCAMTCAGLRVSAAAAAGLRSPDVSAPSAGLGALLPDLVEPRVSRSARRRELEKTMVERCSAMRSTMRSSTCGQIEARCSCRMRARQVAGRLAELGHVGHGHDDVELPLLGRRRLDDLDRPAAGEEARDLLDRAHGGRQPDALGRLRQHRVEPLEGEREVRAALGAGHGVHLVDDDGLDAAQRLARRRGEHEEERLGRRDEDVGRRAGEGAPLVGRGVAGAHADGDVGLGQPEAGGGVADADERAAQVALDVDGERLHRRDVEHPAARLLPPARRSGPAGRGPRGRPTASCPSRSARRRGRGGPQLIASHAPFWADVGALKLPRNQAAVAGEKRSSTSPVMWGPASHPRTDSGGP